MACDKSYCWWIRKIYLHKYTILQILLRSLKKACRNGSQGYSTLGTREWLQRSLAQVGKCDVDIIQGIADAIATADTGEDIDADLSVTTVAIVLPVFQGVQDYLGSNKGVHDIVAHFLGETSKQVLEGLLLQCFDFVHTNLATC